MNAQSQRGDDIAATTQPSRYTAIDLIRGVAMILMALDHVRAFFSHDLLSFYPLQLEETTLGLFLTRWITHFCAPIFFFFAGTGAFLSASKGKSKADLSRFLLKRGLWLVFLDLVVVANLGWRFNFKMEYLAGYVIWALGWSMVIMALLVRLPLNVITAIGVGMIATHDLLRLIHAEDVGSFGWVLTILHQPRFIPLTEHVTLDIAYSLIPWVGVMAAGYGFGRLVQEGRRRQILALGVALTAAFFLVNPLFLYVHPAQIYTERGVLFLVLSFFNADKYPPSLPFLLMTLGPVLLVLGLLKREPGRWARPLITFGRVPMFYYLLHIPLIHTLAIVYAYLKYGSASWLFTGPINWPGSAPYPPDYGFGLVGIYAVWLLALVLLYPLCSWFAAYKRTHRSWWLSYL